MMTDTNNPQDSDKSVEIFTDGACRGNPGPGAWAALLRWKGSEREMAGYEPMTTNNRMELMAPIQALESLKRPCRVRITTDSQYVRNGMTQWIHNWKRRGWHTADKKPVKNQDLWERLDALAQAHQVEWHWVKGHGGHVENERVDQLANDALDAAKRNVADQACDK